MSRLGIVVGAAAAVLASGTALGVSLNPGTDATKAGLTAGLTPLDLSAHVTNAAALTTPSTFEANFSDTFGGFVLNGTIKTEVFANQATPGPGINDVLLVVTMTANTSGAGITPIQFMEFGVNSGVSLDYADILGATHGKLTDEVSAGQTDPAVDLFDNVGNNDTLKYDYASDPLGEVGAVEQFTWYMRLSGAITIDFVDVTVQNGQALTTQALLPVTGTGQDDLNVPAPGVLSAFAGAGLLGLRRRR